MEKKNRKAEKFDWTLAFILLLFAIVSCAAIYSAQYENSGTSFVVKQIIFYGIGSVIAGIVMFFDSDQFKKLSWYLYGIGIFLLVALYFAPTSIAPIRNGAKSWFVIGSLSIQPSEFMKIFLILVLSKIIADHYEKITEKSLKTDFRLLLKLGAATFVPFLLIAEQDLGTALVVMSIFLGMVLVSGVSWKIITPIVAVGASFAGAVFYLVVKAPHLLEKYLGLKQYQFNRIYSWLDPDSFQSGSGYHLYKSLQAIGSGLLTGKGFGERVVYIPESHTDFIFSVIGEEYGFVGSSLVVGLFFILIYHLTKIALDANDPFDTYICAGIISMLAFHVFQNVGMTIQVLPITGIPLPFISYGGSSMMANMFAMGLIFSIRYHHKTYMFGEKRLKQ